MGTENRKRITVETERILIVAAGNLVHGWCEKCGSEVEMSTTTESSGKLPDAGRGLQHSSPGSVGEGLGIMKALLHLLHERRRRA